MKSLKIDVFGTPVLVSRDKDGWSIYYLGAEGKRRPAKDIVVPADISESDLEQYLGDLCHEWATESHPDVTRME